MAQENGRLDASGLKALSVGGRLTPGAADAFEQLRTAGSRAGVTVTITSAADAYRLYEIQERIFTERYQTAYTEYAPGKVDRRVWQGRPWFRRRGTAAAAVPGTSNHGWALAVDIANVGGFNSTFYRWLTDNAPQFGFSNTEGASVGEAWHWVYSPTLHASHGGGAAGPGTTTPPTSEEDDDMPLTNEEIDRIALRVWDYRNAALEGSTTYDILRAGRDGTVTANEVHRLVRDDVVPGVARAEAEATAAKNNTRSITRGGVEVSLRQEIANIGTAVAALPAAIWNVRPTGVSTMADMIIALKQRVIDGHAPSKPLAEMAEIKKLLEEK